MEVSRPGGIHFSGTVNCIFSEELPLEDSSCCYQKGCFLVCCRIRRSSLNWGAAGDFIFVKLLRATSDFRPDTCVTVGRGQERLETKYTRQVQTVAKEWWGLQGWLWVSYSLRSWFLLKLFWPQTSVGAVSPGRKPLSQFADGVPWNHKPALNCEAALAVLR